MKKTLITMMALAGVTQAATVITLGGLGSGDYGYVTDAYAFASVWQVTDYITMTETLSDGNSFTLSNDQSCNFWGGTADGTVEGTWSNSAAIQEVNSVMGTGYTAADFSQGSQMYYTAPGNGGSNSTLSFNFSNASVGDTLTMYVTTTGHAGVLAGFNVSGLNDMTISYAANNGNGFSDTAEFSGAQRQITMIKITGTLTDSALELSPIGGVKTGFQSVAYQIVPEPTTATLSLLALAGLAARRRRR